MMQIQYGRRFVLDVGWVPDLDPKGFFLIMVVQDRDWDDPVSSIRCKTFSELKKAIESSATLIHEKLKIRDLPFRDVEYEEFDYPEEK